MIWTRMQRYDKTDDDDDDDDDDGGRRLDTDCYRAVCSLSSRRNVLK